MISISLLSIKDEEQKIKYMDKLGADYIHFDVMDGRFVENKTDFLDTPIENTPIDVHLMVYDVKKYVDLYQKYHPEYITFHLETEKEIEETIQYIHSKNIKAGLAINPNTPIQLVKDYLDKVDLVLVMSVQPGAGGQEFIPTSTLKLEELKNIREMNSYHYLIEVDGGINNETKEVCKDADILVVGSYITKSANSLEKYQSMKK